MHFHGAYFSNYGICLKDPKHYLPTAHLVWGFIGQDILNSDIIKMQFISGIRITSGLFQFWRSQGIITQIHLKYACSASLIGTILSLAASYFHIHISSPIQQSDTLSFSKKFKSLSYHHLSLLFGLSSISWSAHQIHISLPLNRLLDSGISSNPALIPSPQHLLLRGFIEIILPGFSIGPLVNFSKLCFYAKGVSMFNNTTAQLFNSSTRSVFLAQVTAHHLYSSIVFIPSSVIGFPQADRRCVRSNRGSLHSFIAHIASSWHAQLSMNLAIAAFLSTLFAGYATEPIYPYCASDYPTVLCLFYHHMWIGGFIMVGASAHASIFIIADRIKTNSFILLNVLNHRDVIIGHLLWVSIALGFHSFSLYIHNDTFQALGRSEDIFDDNSIQLYPVFARWMQSLSYNNYVTDIKMLAGFAHKGLMVLEEVEHVKFHLGIIYI